MLCAFCSDLAFTQVSDIPITDSIRSSLQQLKMDGTFEFKTFNFFMSGPQFFNQTFLRLERADFAYNAHCCQLQRRQHHYYGFNSVKRDVQSLLHRIGSYLFGTKRVTRQASDLSLHTCINVTSKECIDDASVNFSDPELVRVISQEELCNTNTSCLDCVKSLCQSNCSINDTSLSVASNTSVLCVATNQSISTSSTPITPSSSTPITPSSSAPINPISLPPPTLTSSVMITPTRSSSYSTPLEVLPTSTNAASTSTPLMSSASCLLQSAITVSTTVVVNRCSSNALQPTPTPIIDCSGDAEQHCEVHDFDFPFNSVECKVCFNNNCNLPGVCDKYKTAHPEFCCDTKRKRSARTKRQDEPCSQEVTALCTNCSTDLIVPDGWFRVENNTQLVCMETQNSIPTSEPTSPPIPPFQQISLTTCYPIEDAFNPCTNLLNDDHYLRVAIWFVIVIAFIGNGLVILVFIVYACFIRRLKLDYFIMHFFYFNLALADFLMCVYLLTIASEDLHTLSDFSVYDVNWRTGAGCGFAGFVAILSTVVSVYVLTVITLERGYTIINAMHRKKINKKVAFVLMGIGWALGLLCAVLPLTGKVSNYSSVAICLPFKVTSGLDKAYVVFLLLATGLAFAVIALTYIIIFSHIFCRRSLSHVSNNRRKTEIKVAIRMFILVATNFVCWFPIALVSLASVFGEGIVKHDISFAKWAIVFILPINACLNPILYSLSTKLFRENFIIVLSKLRLCQESAQRINRERAGVTPSGTSQRSEGDPRYAGRRPTIIERIRLLSISSQGGYSRRGSSISQMSDTERFRFLYNRRRSSVMSDSSNDDSLSGRNPLRRGSSGTSLEEPGVTIQNATFRPSSPTSGESNKLALRAGTKLSVSSLGTLPEETEMVMPETTIKVNPAYIEEVDETGAEMTDLQLGKDVEQYPQHQIHASDSKYGSSSSEENDSGQSGHYSGSPSMEEFDHPTESAQEEIEFD